MLFILMSDFLESFLYKQIAKLKTISANDIDWKSLLECLLIKFLNN